MMLIISLVLFALVVNQTPEPEPYYGNPISEEITTRLYIAPFGCPELGDPHKINGYYYEDPDYPQLCWRKYYYWNPGVPTYQSQFLEMPDLTIGTAYAYEANLMEHTAMYHELSLDGYIDGVALPFCSEISKDVWLKRPDYDWEGPFKVVDCAGLLDLYNVVVHRGEVIEIGFKTAVKWGMVKDLKQTGELSWDKKWDYRRVDNVVVSLEKPPHPVLIGEAYPSWWSQIENLSDWFKDRAIFYRTQSEWDLAYKPLGKTINQVKYWRFEPNGEWINFMEEK